MGLGSYLPWDVSVHCSPVIWRRVGRTALALGEAGPLQPAKLVRVLGLL